MENVKRFQRLLGIRGQKGKPRFQKNLRDAAIQEWDNILWLNLTVQE